MLTNCAHFLPNTEVLTCIKNKLPVPPIPSEQKLETNKKKKHCPDPDSNPWAKGDHYQRPKTPLLKRSGALTNVATEAADFLQKID